MRTLGEKTHDAFSESAVGPFFELLGRVFYTGQPSIGKESSPPIFDPKSHIRERYIDFNYHPLRDSQGQMNVKEARVKNG